MGFENLFRRQGSRSRHFERHKKIISLEGKLRSSWWSWRDSLSQRGEKLACRYLQKQGYKIVARRYQTRFGEIDIIARRAQLLSFIEVKTRQGLSASDPLEAITPRKWQSLQRASLIYLRNIPHKASEIRLEFLGIGIRLEGKQIKLDCVPLFFD